jgi:hypothetical protein
MRWQRCNVSKSRGDKMFAFKLPVQSYVECYMRSPALHPLSHARNHSPTHTSPALRPLSHTITHPPTRHLRYALSLTQSLTHPHVTCVATSLIHNHSPTHTSPALHPLSDTYHSHPHAHTRDLCACVPADTRKWDDANLDQRASDLPIKPAPSRPHHDWWRRRQPVASVG